MKKALIIIVLFLTQGTANAVFKPNSETVTVSTFNIKWYGLGGGMWNHPSQEYRQSFLKRFFEEELASSDIIVFSEIVKTESLAALLFPRMDCVTYSGQWDRHQHTMICYNNKKFHAEKYDTDYIIPEVNLGSGGQRPATQAKICRIHGKCFLQVLGVHLAAGRKTQKRMEQVQYIKNALVKQDNPLPTIILGDFNSYSIEQTGFEKSDMGFFEDILSDQHQQFRSVTRGIGTYNSGERARNYDHIVISHEIKVLKRWGYQACQAQVNMNERFVPYFSFRRYFSDHCPVTAELKIPVE